MASQAILERSSFYLKEPLPMHKSGVYFQYGIFSLSLLLFYYGQLFLIDMDDCFKKTLSSLCCDVFSENVFVGWS